MKTITKLNPIVVAFLIYGCQNILPGNDPVVVDAEKSTVVAVETINSFLKLEAANKDIIKAQTPAIHTYANTIRVHAPDWIASARYLTNVYKNSRTPQNKATLQTALAVLAGAIVQIQNYTTQINQLH